MHTKKNLDTKAKLPIEFAFVGYLHDSNKYLNEYCSLLISKILQNAEISIIKNIKSGIVSSAVSKMFIASHKLDKVLTLKYLPVPKIH